jgi:hypothetical protein
MTWSPAVAVFPSQNSGFSDGEYVALAVAAARHLPLASGHRRACCPPRAFHRSPRRSRARRRKRRDRTRTTSTGCRDRETAAARRSGDHNAFGHQRNHLRDAQALGTALVVEHFMQPARLGRPRPASRTTALSANAISARGTRTYPPEREAREKWGANSGNRTGRPTLQRTEPADRMCAPHTSARAGRGARVGSFEV